MVQYLKQLKTYGLFRSNSKYGTYYKTFSNKIILTKIYKVKYPLQTLRCMG